MSSSAAATVVLRPAVDALVSKIKRNLLARGPTAIIKIAAAFSVANDDSSAAAVPIHSAVAIIESVADVKLSAAETDVLLQWLDRNGEKTIAPAELLAAVRAQTSALRRSVVARLWASFEASAAFAAGDMTVPVDAVMKRFNARAHPAVVRGECGADAVEASTADFFYSAATDGGKIARGAVEAYFATVGASIPRDAEFAAMVAVCWRLPGFDLDGAQALLQHGDSNAPALRAAMTVDAKAEVLLGLTLEKALEELIQHHRRCLAAEKPRAAFRTLGCALRAADAAGTGFVAAETFLARLGDSRLYVAYKPVLQLLDRNGDGSVDYVHYLHALVGELPPSRKVAAERLWRQLPRDRNNCVLVSDVHKRFLGGAQPSPAELALFLDSWDMRKQHGVVTAFELLCEWFVPLSATIEQDSAFVDYLKKQWSLRC